MSPLFIFSQHSLFSMPKPFGTYHVNVLFCRRRVGPANDFWKRIIPVQKSYISITKYTIKLLKFLIYEFVVAWYLLCTSQRQSEISQAESHSLSEIHKLKTSFSNISQNSENTGIEEYLPFKIKIIGEVEILWLFRSPNQEQLTANEFANRVFSSLFMLSLGFDPPILLIKTTWKKV